MSEPLVVVMGVSGSGKSTFGRALSQHLRVSFADGDDLHPLANVTKMRSGTPLTDADRWPWLDRVGEWLAERTEIGGVIACSALRRAYRDRIRHHAHTAEFVVLTGDRDLLAARVSGRTGHFMPSSLLGSQLATLEPLQPDERGLPLDVSETTEALLAEYDEAH